VNEIAGRSKIDFSVAGNQSNIVCTPVRQNFRANVAPDPGVKAAIFSMHKTSGLGVKARIYSPAGTPYGTIYADRDTSYEGFWPSPTGDTVFIPVDSNGYFACESIPQNGTNAGIALNLVAYIY
jgi:hypothetical protein